MQFLGSISYTEVLSSSHLWPAGTVWNSQSENISSITECCWTVVIRSSFQIEGWGTL